MAIRSGILGGGEKSTGKRGKQQSRQTCRNTPLTHAKTRIAGTYISFLLLVLPTRC